MPNVKGGKGYKKNKSNRDRKRPKKATEKIDVQTGEGYYAKIRKRLGGAPAEFEALLHDGSIHNIQIRGRMRKKEWVNCGMIVLINKDYEIVKIIKDYDQEYSIANRMIETTQKDKIAYNFIEDDEDSDEEYEEIELKTNDEKKEEIDDSDLMKMINPNRKKNKILLDEEEFDEESDEINIDDI